VTLYLKPEATEPPPEGAEGKQPLRDLTEKVHAAANTVNMLSEHGLEVNLMAEDKETAHRLTMSYAEDPEKTSRAASVERVGKLTPASLMLTDKLLREFGHRVVDSSTQLRYYVTNRLIEESDHSDARIRIRALELLGKISDVGLFAEKSEVTITHQTSDDLRQQLKQKLQKMIDVTPVEEDTLGDEAASLKKVDVGKEFGYDDDNPVPDAELVDPEQVDPPDGEEGTS